MKMNRGIAGNLSGIAAAALFALVSCVMENGDTPASRPVESVAFNFGADTRAGNGGGKPSITLNVKESYDLAGALVFTPPDADNKGVSWYIDEAVPSGKLNGADVKAVTLDTETGVITAAVTRAAYEAIPEAQRELPVTVGVITDDGNKSAECAVNVVFTPVPVASVAINGGASSLNLFAGETAALTAAVSPANANNYTLQWASSAPAVVTVDEATGALTAQNVAADTNGTVVTVTAVDNGDAPSQTGTITVNVKKFDVLANVNSTERLAQALEIIAADTENEDKEYTITITGDITLTDANHLIKVDPITDTRFQGKKITITDNNSGKKLILGANRIGEVITVGKSSGSVTAGNEATVILTGSITVRGTGTLEEPNNAPLVSIKNGGIFELDGSAKLTGNIKNYQFAGVNIQGGKFLMKGGEISDNTVTGEGAYGGGVTILVSGQFAMSGGVIARNRVIATSSQSSTMTGKGAGVFFMMAMASNSFTKTGGVIYGCDGGADANSSNVDGVLQTDADNRGITVSVGTPAGYLDTTAGTDHNIDVRAGSAVGLE